jgi:integrase
MGKPWEVIKDGSVSIAIYRVERTNGHLHTVVWYEGEKRCRKAFADPSKARAHARQIARGISRLGSTSLTLTGDALIAYQRARQILGDEPIDTAAAELSEGRRLSGGQVLEACRAWGDRTPADAPPVAEVVKEFVAAKEQAGRSKAHVDDLRKRLDRFAGAFRVPLSLVTARQVETWVRSLHVSPRTQRNFVGSVSSLVHWSERRGYLPKGFLDLSGIELARTIAHVRIFTPKELQDLLGAAQDPRMVAFLALGAFAGLRTAEIQRLNWEDVQPTHVNVRAENSKTRQRRFVPVLRALSSWLEPIRSTGRVCDWYGLQKPLTALSKKAGVKWVHNGLRHSFGTYRMAIVEDEAKVALEMGNSPGMIFRHYRAVAGREQAEAWFGTVRGIL